MTKPEADKIKSLMKKQIGTPAQLGRIIQVSKPTAKKYWNNPAMLRMRHLRALAKHGVDVCSIINIQSNDSESE